MIVLLLGIRLLNFQRLGFGLQSFAQGPRPTQWPSRRAASRGCTRRTVVHAESGGFLPLEVFQPAVNSYFASSPPLFQEMKASFLDNPFAAHWIHAAGGTLLFLYAAYGIFLGYQVRMGNGSTVYPASYDQTAAERHPWMMGVVLLFLLFEIPDGLTILAANDQPLLQSTHASTAVIAFIVMAIVGSVGLTMGAYKTARDAHTYLGLSSVIVLIAHAYFGLYLGWSF